MTDGHRRLSPEELTATEPALIDRVAGALNYAEQGHLSPEPALHFLLDQAQAAGADVRFGEGEMPADADLVIDCRGLAAKDQLSNLRGVRGERIVVKSREVNLTHPVRLLHPRFPLYVVPWGDGVYMIGATVIESEETGPISVRSALDLLSAAYALDPAFAEAEIVLQGASKPPLTLLPSDTRMHRREDDLDARFADSRHRNRHCRTRPLGLCGLPPVRRVGVLVLGSQRA